MKKLSTGQIELLKKAKQVGSRYFIVSARKIAIANDDTFEGVQDKFKRLTDEV